MCVCVCECILYTRQIKLIQNTKQKTKQSTNPTTTIGDCETTREASGSQRFIKITSSHSQFGFIPNLLFAGQYI